MSALEDAIDAIFTALKDLNPRSVEHLDQTFREFEESRKAADAAAHAKSLSEKEIARQTEVARTVLELATGLKTTISAFHDGDPLEGTAGVMDICSTAASLLSSLADASSMGGPVGALAAAVFGIVGMILRAFEPKQKSLSSMLEEKLRLLQGEQVAQHTRAAILEFERLYSSYPTIGPVDISRELDQLAQGNAADNLLKSNEWLAMPTNIQSGALTAVWLEILSANVHAGSLELRNLTHLLSVASPEGSDYQRLDRLIRKVAEQHRDFMHAILDDARGKGLTWHLGIVIPVYAGYPTTGYQRAGTNLNYRQGIDRTHDWTNLGGEHRVFAVARDRGGEGRHVVAFEGNWDEGYWTCSTYHPFPHLERAYTMSVGGSWPSSGTGWHELPQLAKCRDACALPGDAPGESYVFVIQDNAARCRKLTRTKDGVTLGDDLESAPQSAAGDTLLSIRVTPGYRPGGPVEADRVLYLLVERDGQHLIKRGPSAALTIYPRWRQVRGMTVDQVAIWIWGENEIAYITHEKARELEGATDENAARRAWHYRNLTNDTILDRSPGVGAAGPGCEYNQGLTHVSASLDGTLTLVFNSRIYTATPGPSRYSDGIEATWRRKDTETKATRVVKEPIPCWKAFEGRLKALERLARPG